MDFEVLETSKTFSKNTQCYIFVYDITSKDSLEELIEYIEKAKHDNKDKRNVLYYLVGNNCDLTRQIARNDVHIFAQKWGFTGFFEVSARNDYSSIEWLFENVTKEICR